MKRIALALAAAVLTGPSLAAAGSGANEPNPGADGYTLDTTGSARSLARGQKGNLVVAIRPKAPWHVDPRAPLSLKLETPPGLVAEKASAGRKDAVDPKAEIPRFELPVTAAAAGAQDGRQCYPGWDAWAHCSW